MTLTPQDIEAQVFREKFKGYDQDEVDAFLDRVSDQLGSLVRERDELSQRVRTLESETAESVEDQGLLKRTLLTAQRSADETVARATAEAESATEEAERRAAETMQDAERQSAELVADARSQADQLLSEARRESAYAHETSTAELERVRTAVADLQRFRSEYQQRVRGVIAEQLALLDRAGDVPDLPLGMTQLAQRLESDARPAEAPESGPPEASWPDGSGPEGGADGADGADGQEVVAQDVAAQEADAQEADAQEVATQDVAAQEAGAQEVGAQGRDHPNAGAAPALRDGA